MTTVVPYSTPILLAAKRKLKREREAKMYEILKGTSHLLAFGEGAKLFPKGFYISGN